MGTVARTVIESGTPLWPAIFSAIAAIAAAITAIILAVIAHRQLAVIRAQTGERGSVKVSAARPIFDPRLPDRNQAVSYLRDPPRAPLTRIRVVALHLRNIGPIPQRVGLAHDYAILGPTEEPREVAVYPAWGRQWQDQVETRAEYDLMPARDRWSGSGTFALYVVLGEDDKRLGQCRMRVDLMVGGGEIIHFDGQVILWLGCPEAGSGSPLQ